MNRQQRRAMAKQKGNQSRKHEPTFSYNQGLMLANEAYKKGKEKAQEETSDDYPKIFMYTFGLIMKTLREKWGWGHVRLARLTNQILEEYNDNDMNIEEIQEWMWEYIGIKLQIDDNP